MEGINKRDFFEIAIAACFVPFLQTCSKAAYFISRNKIANDDIGNIPTVELHRHLEAGMSPETMALLAQKNKISQVLTRNGKVPIEGVDPQDPDSIRNYYQRIFAGFKKPDGFSRFLDSLGLPVSVMVTLQDLETAAYQQILEQARNGSIHTELRGSPYTYQEKLIEKVTLEDVINAIRKGIRKAYTDHGASGAFIACFSRNKADKYGKDVVNAVLKTHTLESPVGLDIAGAPESEFPPAMFEKLLQPAREAGVPITIHAGEQSAPPEFKKTPPSFVKDAVEKLGARRIGHGTSLIADAKLRDWIREKNICIECCPVSNDAMGYMPLEKHPMREFLDAGLRVTANTDDPIPFGLSGVRDMFVKYGKVLRLNPTDVIQMTRNGIAAAFVTPERRLELERRL
ncbi:adenosine deaminase family protein [Candidatus Peregrinibacteria bacterium]|nr:adenosine deaminase family protein [Candidatus Peregrinibacteria bacterium]